MNSATDESRVPWKPTRAQLAAAKGKTLPDVIAPGLKILFCGINPGLYTAAVGHHFARPGNRFWPALHAAGLTPRLLNPFEEKDLLQLGYGVTNVVAHATATADELTEQDFIRGGRALQERVQKYKPRILAILGLGAYRVAFNRPKAVIGRQPEFLGQTRIWALPNPSGLNANYQAKDFARLFREVDREARRRAGITRGVLR